MQPNDPTQTQQPLQQAMQQPQLIARHECWCFPKGRTVFSAVKSVAYLYPGWLIAVDAATNQEHTRIQLTPNMKISHILGSAVFTEIAGQKTGAFDPKKSFYFYNPRLNVLSYMMGLLYRNKVNAFISDCRIAAGRMQ